MTIYASFISLWIFSSSMRYCYLTWYHHENNLISTKENGIRRQSIIYMLRTHWWALAYNYIGSQLNALQVILHKKYLWPKCHSSIRRFPASVCAMLCLNRTPMTSAIFSLTAMKICSVMRRLAAIPHLPSHPPTANLGSVNTWAFYCRDTDKMSCGLFNGEITYSAFEHDRG